MNSFAWDHEKARTNLLKHGVSFELASEVFTDLRCLSRIDDRFRYEEERWVTMGLVRGVVVLVVAHTAQDEEEGDVIRIISARRATRSERKAYEQHR